MSDKAKYQGQRCTARGCDRPAVVKGLCKKHYSRKRFRERREAMGLPVLKRGRPRLEPRACSMPGCKKRMVSKGLCETHYNTQYQRERRKRQRANDPNYRPLPVWWKAKSKSLPSDPAERRDRQRFSERFRQLCRESGLNGEGMASRLGVHRATVSCYLQQTWPGLQRTVQIARRLDVSTDWLLGLTGSRKPFPAPKGRGQAGDALGRFTRRFGRLYREGGLIQKDFAARAKISHREVGLLLSGGRPEMGTLVRISRGCRVSCDWLLGVTERR